MILADVPRSERGDQMRGPLVRVFTAVTIGLATVAAGGAASAATPVAATPVSRAEAPGTTVHVDGGPIRAATTVGPYQLVFYHSNKCLDVRGGVREVIPLTQYDCVAGAQNQQWYQDYRDGQWFQLRNRKTGWCVNVAGYQTGNNTPLVQYPCGAGYNNEWFDTAYNTGGYPPQGVWWVEPFIAPNKAIHVPGASQYNNAPVTLWDMSKALNTWIYFRPV
jgi:hypothetical protein